MAASATRKLDLSDRNACDLELLAVGGFSPLTGFMNEEAYEGVVDNMRLPGSNLLFGRGLHSLTSKINLRTFRNTSLTLELNLSTFGPHPRVVLGCMRDK